MDQHPPPLFAFSEEDHLTRLHLRLALEDIGFAVAEAADELRLEGAAVREERPLWRAAFTKR